MMLEKKTLVYNGCTILVTKMEGGYVKNIFDDAERVELPKSDYSPLSGRLEGALDDAKRLVDEWNVKRKTPS